MRRRLGKADAIDAEAAARACLAGTATATPKAGADQVEIIRMLKVAKDSATEGKTCAINQIKALLVTAPAGLRERLGNLTRRPLIDACAALRPGVLDGPMAAAKRALRTLARRIQSLQQEIEVLLSDLDTLTRLSALGCAKTTAWASTALPRCSQPPVIIWNDFAAMQGSRLPVESVRYMPAQGRRIRTA